MPLWQETQSVAVDRRAGSRCCWARRIRTGYRPRSLRPGEARWMGLLFARPGEVERPRVRITSVPYALKASDAETLGGRPASAYLLAPTAGDERGRDGTRKARSPSRRPSRR